VGDIDFQTISASESSNKFQKTRFWKEKSVEDMITNGTDHTSHGGVNHHSALCREVSYICENNGK
jgi:hypothetical protein